jgi:hypothetical protein
MWTILLFKVVYNFDGGGDDPRFVVKVVDSKGRIHKFGGVIELDDFGTTLVSFYVRDCDGDRVQVGQIVVDGQIWDQIGETIDDSNFGNALRQVTSAEWKEFAKIADIVRNFDFYLVD